jgi:hypothetical protein
VADFRLLAQPIEGGLVLALLRKYKWVFIIFQQNFCIIYNYLKIIIFSLFSFLISILSLNLNENEQNLVFQIRTFFSFQYKIFGCNPTEIHSNIVIHPFPSFLSDFQYKKKRRNLKGKFGGCFSHGRLLFLDGQVDGAQVQLLLVLNFNKMDFNQ